MCTSDPGRELRTPRNTPMVAPLSQMISGGSGSVAPPRHAAGSVRVRADRQAHGALPSLMSLTVITNSSAGSSGARIFFSYFIRARVEQPLFVDRDRETPVGSSPPCETKSPRRHRHWSRSGRAQPGSSLSILTEPHDELPGAIHPIIRSPRRRGRAAREHRCRALSRS